MSHDETTNQDLWRHACDALEEPVLIIDTAERVLHANRAARHEMKVAEDRSCELSLAEFDREPWIGCRSLARLVRMRGGERQRELHETHSGRHWSIRCRALTRMPDAETDPAAPLLLVLREKTEFHLLQGAMRRYEKMAELARIVGGIAHQVSNPLFAISGSVESLKLQFRGNPDVRPVLEILEEEVVRLSGLMRSFVEFGTYTCNHRARFEISHLVSETVSGCRRRFGFQPERTLVDVEEGARALLDRDAIVLALDKILENAFELSPPGGKIYVRGRALAGEALKTNKGPTFELTVADEGPGIPAAFRRRVFEPFFTRRERHTGLGLSLAERLVVAHGGDLACRESSRGATLVLRLPVLAQLPGSEGGG